MSKEIAQTFGGKRVAWLIAIVAAFAVFATVGTQWRTSEAALPSGLVTVTQTSANPDPGATVAWTATFVFSPSGVTLPAATDVFVVDFDDELTFVSAAVGALGGLDNTGDCVNSGVNTVTCTSDGSANAWTNGSIVFTFTNPLFTTEIEPPDTCSLTQAAGPPGVCDVSATALYDTEGVQVSPETATNALGVAEVYTFTFPAGETCVSDPAVAPAPAPLCTAADVNLSAGLSLLAGPTTVGQTVLVTVINSSAASTGGTVSLDVQLNVGTGPANLSEVGTKVYVNAELRHIPDGVAGNTGTVIPLQEISTNVRGSRHTICTVEQNTGIDGTDAGTAQDAPATPIQVPGLTLANIVITNGGGYTSTADTDPDFTDVRIFVGDGTALGTNVNSGLSGATCISWVSTDAGDQQINLIYVGADGLNYNVSWDSDANGNGQTVQTNRSLVKEWNRLEDSTLTLGGGSSGSITGTNSVATPTGGAISKSIAVVLNPSTGLYQFNAVTLADVFRGSHTNSAGVKEGPFALAGVNWTVVLTGCGTLGASTLSGTTYLDASGAVVGGPSVTFDEGATVGTNCGPGRTATVTFTGTEPGPLGSGTGITVIETATFTFTQNIAEKKVFLAWAGQRIILETDWRLPAGDVDGGSSNSVSPLGVCAFQEDGSNTVPVTYVKGSGPGNFLPSGPGWINGSDEAGVYMQTSDSSQTDDADDGGNGDIVANINGVNGMCISRVLFESEDQGQVDIEAFVEDEQQAFLRAGLNSTKVAFVIYYMKINTINVSLVTQVSKPSHNSSNRTVTTQGGSADATHAADFSPGNPWDASKDDADNAADWNVSKDLLVRGRVTGWFLNSNPSGRAADTSNPLNVLPANRWVMPNDWPLLAGGPADPADGTDAVGTAEQFRPYYDIMFAPNNTRGIALNSPEGTDYVQVAVVITNANNYVNSVSGLTAGTSGIVVSQCGDLVAGSKVLVGGGGVFTVVSCSSNFLIITSATGGPFLGLSAIPAAGTPILLATGVPFEGPYSTLDIIGLAAQGLGGAALSDWDNNNIRDTMLDDGDVDWWDAPMPAAPVSVAIRGTGFIKEVIKDEVYYLGTANSASQTYPNPYYIQDIPASPFIPAVVAGGGYLWDTWGLDGPGNNGQGVYRFWTPALIGTNSEYVGEITSTTSTDGRELGLLRTYFGDLTIARDLVVYSDNHGEFMVAANGDFKTDLTACATNVLAGGKHCKPGDKVGTGAISATVDYPDFRGKHFPVLSNTATVTWTWGGYKDVTVEAGETDQFKYIVFHAMDRDGFCSPLGTGAVLLHSVLGRASAYSGISDDLDTAFTIANLTGSSPTNARHNDDPNEAVDFLIDSGEGIIVGTSSGNTINPPINDGRQFATGINTYSVAENDPASTGIKEFGVSALAATGQTDECQAWIKVSNSLLGILNILAIAKDDEGNIGFDKIIDLTNTTSYTLNFRWSLVTWAGADAITVSDAIKGTGTSGKNPGGNDISASVTAIYGWDAAAQQWLGYFPSGVNVPGANDLVSLKTGQAYWIAITGPSSVTWTIASNVN